MFWRSLFFIIYLSILLGCQSQKNLDYPLWFKPSSSYMAIQNDSNSFGAYTSAAIKTEQMFPQFLYKVHFTPGQKQAIINALTPIVHTLLTEINKPFEFQYQAVFPNQHPPFQRGWRLISHALIWKIESFIYQSQWNNAMKLFLTATKFGINLTGGNVLDASLGFQIADEARHAFLSALGKLSSVELEFLYSRLKDICDQRPKIKTTLLHEKETMLASIQYIQDCYQKNQLSDLQNLLGNSAKEAITYLHRMKSKDSKLRPDYFQYFAQEIDSLTAHLAANIDQPAAKRTSFIPQLKVRPWKRLAKHFIGSAQSLGVLNDRALAHLRLLILHSKIKQIILKNRIAPKNLEGFPKDLIQDPFSGLPFVYQRDGSEFKIYSVGENLRDDGGISDETGLQPDLVLEEKY